MTTTLDVVYLVFFTCVGACVGSFLNVVIWRLPRGESLLTPGSHCPKCQKPIRWYDNIPVLGWLALRGRCRFCGEGIALRYPLVEAATALIFAAYYALFFMVHTSVHIGPCEPRHPEQAWAMVMHEAAWLPRDWPVYVLDMVLLSGLLAASIIDAELFVIPLEIPYIIAPVAVAVHTLHDRVWTPGSLAVGHPALGAMTAGAAVGLAVSFVLWLKGRMPQSFAQGEPILEVDRDALAEEIRLAKREGRELPPLPPAYTRGQIRLEMGKEMLFLLPPMGLGLAAALMAHGSSSVADFWDQLLHHAWVAGMLGSLLGAMAGAMVVWMTRIAGTLGFGRVAMGLGDVHLMFGVGAVLGAGASVITFFLAPFFGIAMALYMLFSGKRRELPYGPYLSLAAAFVMLFYCPIADWLSPGMMGMMRVIREAVGRG